MKEKINILFLVHGFEVGGVERSNVLMINEINKKKFNVYVLYINEGLLMDDLNLDRVAIEKLGDKFKLKSISNIKYILKIIRYIKRNNIDIVHTIDPILYMIGSIAAHFSKIGHVRTQPNFIRRHEKLNARTLKVLPFEKWSDKYITYNHASNKDLQLAGVASEKIETVYGFQKLKDNLMFNNLKDIKDEFNIPKSNKIILAMHRMVPQKGFETFIEMIPHIVKEYEDVCFLLVGDGPLRTELESKVEKLKMDKFVRFIGFRKDIVNIAKQVDFGVYPLADTAGMTIVFNVGKVLITKKNSSMDEYINDGVTGYLTPDDDPKTYASYSLRLLKDEKLLRNMESKQREYTLEYLDGKKNMEKFEDILITLCEKKRV